MMSLEDLNQIKCMRTYVNSMVVSHALFSQRECVFQRKSEYLFFKTLFISESQ